MIDQLQASNQSNSAKKRLIVLISGGGSNLQAFIDLCASGDLNATVVAVISNKPDAGGLDRAAAKNIPNLIIDHRNFENRESFDQALSEMIDSFAPDLIILAGFMRILTSEFVNHFDGKLINIHPSLLPAYPGLNTHRRAIEAGDKEAGATVHFVTSELDGGPAIIQARVPIEKSDNEQTLAAKVLQFEHKIFPEAVRWFCEDRLCMQEDIALLDNQPLPSKGIIFNSETNNH
jgi:phosphoribosylglycinamide formyltransferase-1